MIDLDDIAAMTRQDPSGMMALTVGFPEQCERGVEIGNSFDPPAGWPTGPQAFGNVVVTGLGGSAIGGDFLRSITEHEAKTPILVNRDYDLPGYVGDNSLIIAVSYSGNTEETLSAYDQAKARGARILVLTSGGALLERARADGNPALVVPGGQQPRASSGYTFFPVWRAVQKLGIISDKSADTNEAVSLMKRQRDAFRPEEPTSTNSAKQLAKALGGKLPVIYGSQGFRGIIAYRWHTQFNENAKIHAFSGAFPEMNHNEILGWINAPKQADDWAVVMIRDRKDTSKIATRVDTTKRLIGAGIPIHDVYADGESALARLWTGVYYGDFVSVYLALVWGEDPTVIPSIDALKVELAKVQ
ncbi:MAG TPA: bifunctional phosphoglucose/phosphomannose isomerase [Capsulimonadaceae bacterium]|nr:bifunctional phosphoglucose/phosphomannose isomerase [Capsulimonadaceae bacterium]